jgi:hypothetical protein
MLSKIEAVLDDAEEKQDNRVAVKKWLDDLRDLAYDAEDILDEFATEALRRKLMGGDDQATTSKGLIPQVCFFHSNCCLDQHEAGVRDGEDHCSIQRDGERKR